MSAADEILAKVLLPTDAASAEIREALPSQIRRRAFFSARTTEGAYLKRLQGLCAAVAKGEMDNARAREEALRLLDAMGYEPEGEGLMDKSSQRRLNLILDTQRQMAHNVALLKRQTPAELELYPAWKLERYESKVLKRADWPQRWKAAGEAVGWQGASREAMVALKSSPIWQALGDGAGGFTDTLGNPYPPFAFQSGLGWTPVEREALPRYGLRAAGGLQAPSVSLAPGAQAIREAAAKFGQDFMEGLFE